METGIPRFSKEFRFPRELDTICSHLYLRELKGTCGFDDVHEFRVNRWLTARELNCCHWHGFLVLEDLEHLDHFVVGGLENVTSSIGIRKTYRALEIASVRQIKIRQTRAAEVELTKAAVQRADLGICDLRVVNAVTIEGPLLGSHIHVEIRPDHVLERPVVVTRLSHLQCSVVLEQLGRDDLLALRTKRLSFPRKTLTLYLGG